MRSTTRRSQVWRTARVILGSILAVGFLALAFRGVDVGHLRALLEQADVALLAGALALGSVNLLLRAARWRVLLSASGRVPLGLTFWILDVGYLLNSILPMRAGDLGRSYLMGRRGGMGGSFALATTLAERVMDAGFLVVAGGLAIVSHPLLPTWLSRALAVLAIASLIALLGMLALPPVWGRVGDRLEGIPGLSSPFGRLRRRWLDRFFDGLASIRHLGRMLQYLTLTLAVWLVDASATLLVARSLGADLSFSSALVLLAALGITSTIPLTPGQIGVYQWVAASVIVSYGISREPAVLVALGLQAITYLVVMSWGVVATLKLGGPEILRMLGGLPGTAVGPDGLPEDGAG
jgi:glycosyltransferase 2 family protein